MPTALSLPSITPKQKALLEFVCRFQTQHGYGPSQQEIAQHFGYKSLGTVQNYLVRLQSQGALEKSWNSKRGIQVHPRFLKAFAAHSSQDLQKKILPTNSQPHTVSLSSAKISTSVLLPVLGQVAAGRPLEVTEASDAEEIAVPSSLFNSRRPLQDIPDDHFVLKVKGDSMIEDGILEGDLVIVRKQSDAKNGDTVVALINNEATIKRFQRSHKNPQSIELHPANPQYQPLIIESLTDAPVDFKIAGVMVGLIRRSFQ